MTGREIRARTWRRRPRGDAPQPARRPGRSRRHPHRPPLGLDRRHRLRHLRREHLTGRFPGHRPLHRGGLRSSLPRPDRRAARIVLRPRHQHTAPQLRCAEPHTARGDPTGRHGGGDVDLLPPRPAQRAAVDGAFGDEIRTAPAGRGRDGPTHASHGPRAHHGGRPGSGRRRGLRRAARRIARRCCHLRPLWRRGSAAHTAPFRLPSRRAGRRGAGGAAARRPGAGRQRRALRGVAPGPAAAASRHRRGTGIEPVPGPRRRTLGGVRSHHRGGRRALGRRPRDLGSRPELPLHHHRRRRAGRRAGPSDPHRIRQPGARPASAPAQFRPGRRDHAG